MTRLLEVEDLKKRVVEQELVITSFHSYYHLWPGPSGEITNDILCELLGCSDAKINTKHIDFYEKNHAELLTWDLNNKNLFFKTDDSIGTCEVFVNPD